MRVEILVVVWVAVLVTACGDDGAPSDAGGDSGAIDTGAPSDAGDAGDAGDADVGAPDAGSTSIAEADLAPHLAAAWCNANRPCCEVDSMVPGDCVAAAQADIERILMRPRDGMAYDAAEAGRCVAALEALSTDCSAARASAYDYQRPCSFVIDGTAPPGDVCETAEQCDRPAGGIGSSATGYVGCAPYGGVADKRCRAFVPTTTVGAACEMAFMGEETTVSVCAGGDLYCGVGVCREAQALGEPCGSSESRCGVDAYCEAGAIVCTARPGDGDACTIDGESCIAGLECASDTCQRTAPLRIPNLCLGLACVAQELACAPVP